MALIDRIPCLASYGLCALVLLGCEEAPKAGEKAEPGAAAPAKTAATLQVATAAPAQKAEEPTPGADIECAEGPNADFHDKALEEEVRRKLEKPEGDIKTSELRKVRSINLAKDAANKVDYLDPCIFPHLTNVKDLFLAPGKLSDISLLAKLTNLESVRLSMNQVSDLTPLEGLSKLDRLDLGHTQVTDVTPLAKLTTLTELQLDNTRITDVSALTSLDKLERLSLQRTEVKDIAPLKGLKSLKFLYIAGSRVEDPYAASRPGLKVVDQ
jgi:internalin A